MYRALSPIAPESLFFVARPASRARLAIQAVTGGLILLVQGTPAGELRIRTFQSAVPFCVRYRRQSQVICAKNDPGSGVGPIISARYYI